MSKHPRPATAMTLAALVAAMAAAPLRAEITKVFLIPFSHQDIGFTATQTEVAEKYRVIYDELPGLFGRIPDFRFTVETFWQFERWLEARPSAAEIDFFVEQARKGRIEFMAAYGSMHSGFQNAFSLAETMRPALDFARSHGLQVKTAMMNDVPGYVADLPDILADAGIPYFMTGVNQGLAVCNELAPADWLFWWEGPRGKRVLTWVGQESYMEGIIIKSTSDLEATLRKLERDGYPYDAIPLMVAGDNRGYAPGIIAHTEFIRDAVYLKKGLVVEMATPTAFFDHMVAKYGDRLSVKRGDWSGWWDVLKNSGPRSAALMRRVQYLLGDLDRAGELDRASPTWIPLRTDLLTYMEHATHGTAGWPGLLTQAQVDDSNLKVIEYADRAAAATTKLIDRALDARRGPLAFLGLGSTQVWNASGSPDPQLISFGVKDWNPDRRPLVDLGGREYGAIPFEGSAEDPWRPIARGYEFTAPLPPGFSGLRIIRWEPYLSFPAVGLRAMESTYFRIEFDDAWNILAVKDRKSGALLGGPGFGEALESFNPLVVKDSDLRRLDRGAVRASLSRDSAGARAVLTGSGSALARLVIELPDSRAEIRLRYEFSKPDLVYTPYRNHSRNYYVRFPVGSDWAFSYRGPASLVEYPYGFTRRRPTLFPAPDGIMLSRKGSSISMASREAFMAGYFQPQGYVLWHLFRDYGQTATKDKGIVDMNEIEPGSPDIIPFTFVIAPRAGASPADLGTFLRPAVVR